MYRRFSLYVPVACLMWACGRGSPPKGPAYFRPSVGVEPAVHPLAGAVTEAELLYWQKVASELFGGSKKRRLAQTVVLRSWHPEEATFIEQQTSGEYDVVHVVANSRLSALGADRAGLGTTQVRARISQEAAQVLDELWFCVLVRSYLSRVPRAEEPKSQRRVVRAELDGVGYSFSTQARGHWLSGTATNPGKGTVAQGLIGLVDLLQTHIRTSGSKRTEVERRLIKESGDVAKGLECQILAREETPE